MARHAVTTMTALVGVGGAVVMFAFCAWRFWFFHRNPVRAIAPGTDPVCPADGRILYADDVDLDVSTQPYHARIRDAFDVAGRWSVVATYLGIFDVHFVRAPIAGRVRLRQLAPLTENLSMGSSLFYAALRCPLPIGRRAYCDKNELLAIELVGDTRLVVVLMADWWIDQIRCFVRDGDQVERGAVIGNIFMGSQVDVWSPYGAIALAAFPGDAVRAGQRVLARIDRAPTR